jgi:Ca2+-binding RTX toxin-like protein
MAYSNDFIVGTDGPDSLYGHDGDDEIRGRGGDDELFGGTGDDKLFGNDGDDQLIGGSGQDRLLGGAGNDVMDGRAGNDIYWVDAEYDRVVERLRGGIDEIITSLPRYSLMSAQLSGQEIENVTVLSDSDSRLLGNYFNNVLTSGAGNDELVGFSGNDILQAGAGSDRLHGQEGNDRLLGGEGDDVMYGGGGDDVYSVLDAGDQARERNNDGYDTIFAAIDYQLPRNVEKLTLGNGAAVGRGNAIDNLIVGHDGDNRLVGGFGDDDLRGGGGDDRLVGGPGIDRATGGVGSDEFVFLDGEVGASRRNADAILDFSRAEGDLIVLEGIDSRPATDDDDVFTFIGSGAFSGEAGELHARVVNGNTFVEADLDGDRVADLVIRLSGETVLTASDFVL